MALSCRIERTYEDDGAGTSIDLRQVTGIPIEAGGSVTFRLVGPPVQLDGTEYRFTARDTSVSANVQLLVAGTSYFSTFLTLPSVASEPVVVDRHTVELSVSNPSAVAGTASVLGLLMETVRQNVTEAEICIGQPDGNGRPGIDGTDPGYHVTLTLRRGPVTAAMPRFSVGEKVALTFARFGWTTRPFLVTRVRTIRRGLEHWVVVELDKLPGTSSDTGTSFYITVGQVLLGRRIKPG